MHFASAAYLKGIRAVRLIYSQRHVLERLLKQPFAQMPRGYVFALLARERTVVYAEVHFNGRLAYFYKRHGVYLGRRANRIAYRYLFNSAEAHYVAYVSLFYGNALKSFYLKQVYYFALIRRNSAMIIADDNLFCHINAAALYSAYADTSYVIVVIYSGHKQLKLAVRVALGRGNVFYNRIEQRLKVGTRDVIILCGCGVLARAI